MADYSPHPVELSEFPGTAYRSIKLSVTYERRSNHDLPHRPRAGRFSSFVEPPQGKQAHEGLDREVRARTVRIGCMAFEINTLFLLTIDVEAILGILLLLVWVQNTRVSAVAWWASAHLMRACSVMLYGLYGAVPDLISIDLSTVILFSASGLTWNGARIFNGRRALPGSLIAGAVLWLFVMQWPALEAGAETRRQLSAMIIRASIWLTAYEFWRGRSEPLVSRWPAIV